MATTPEVLWAQRSSETDAEKNLIYLTINAPDVADSDIKLTPTSLSFSGDSANGKKYAVDIDFYDEIDVDNSTYHLTGRFVFFILRKKDAKAEFWPRLTKEKVKLHYVKTDFDKWVDEDEQEDAPTDDFSQYGNGLDFSALQNDLGSAMGGLGGLGNLGGGDAAGPSSLGLGDDSDDEDEEIEELDTTASGSEGPSKTE
ncbi:HSP20-like chaperone [Dipodascopsis uninucleata]